MIALASTARSRLTLDQDERIELKERRPELVAAVNLHVGGQQQSMPVDCLEAGLRKGPLVGFKTEPRDAELDLLLPIDEGDL